ncbi:hypothetical protein AB0346_10725 [Nocardia beijingensis]|uniref:ornithine cyclodeaminase family protein n=1 Tax=Nocardia beijingensis TaxID=95162 RepID=UPI00344F4433
MHTLVLRPEDIKRTIELHGRDEVMSRVIARLTEHLTILGMGLCENSPPRSGFTKSGDTSGVIEFMPHHHKDGAVTMKTITYSPSNPGLYRLPTVLGFVCRIDENTGMPTVLADGVVLTAIRTGAASAIASRLLSSPDSELVGIVGAGAQAVTQLHGLKMVRNIAKVLVFDTDVARAANLERRASFLDVEFEVASPERIIDSCDIICTATSVGVGAGPVLPDGMHREHLHINSIGADEVGKTELPVSLLRRSFVCVDHMEQARTEGESQQLAAEEIGPTLDYLCANPARAVEHQQDLTVFDSTGFAFEDHVALDVLLELSSSIGVGEKVSIVHNSADPFDPYYFF